MSHELASLLLTETVQFSLNVSKQPVYALFLDAKSAFDRVVPQRLIRNLFLAGTNDQRLLHIDQRLKSRRTYCEFDKQMMGPIIDTRGLEQGGVFSSDAYKIYNNEQAMSAQSSLLGVSINKTCISCITMADDAVLLSNGIIDLNNLLYLTERYCEKYDVQLVPDKIRLVAFAKDETWIEYDKNISPITISGNKISFSDEAEHLGVIRSATADNTSNIMNRISAHRSKLFSILPAGLANHHHSNPAAVLKVERLYASPVLLSGLASLVLSKSELDTLQKYHKNCIRLLMKLPERTSDCVVYFLAGSLPLTALLHLRQLSLFNMITHLSCNPLHSLAFDFLVRAKPSAKSWFQMIRALTIQYGLPHPLDLLEAPVRPQKFKSLCKLKVKEFWRIQLTNDAMMSSLRFLKSEFLSLTYPHPLRQSLDGNPYQTKAARIQALILTGKYPTERFRRFWSGNDHGYCLFSPCFNLKICESVEHMLLHCPAVSEERRRLALFTSKLVLENNVLEDIVPILSDEYEDDVKVQFLADCSTLPKIISAFQIHGEIIHQLCFKISRTWCRSIHVARLKKLGRYYKD